MKDIEIFTNYVNKFDLNDKDIHLKFVHSLKTRELSKKIGEMLNISKKDLILAQKIGLLHDIGRFKQLNDFHSYSDMNIDHAREGIKVLFNENEIEKYFIDLSDYSIVQKSIFNHNKYKIEDNLTSRELFFSKLIRDCDKIDIFYRFIEQDVLFNEDDGKINKNVNMCFKNRKCVNSKDILTGNDKIISILCFIYDISFKESLIYISKNKILDKLFEIIKDKDKFSNYFDSLNKYIKEKLGE